MKKSFIILFSMLLLVGSIADAQINPIKRGQKHKTEQTKKQPKIKSSKTSKKNQNVAQGHNERRLQEGTTAKDDAIRTANQRSPYVPKVEKIYVMGTTFDMVYVEGGTFKMGATSEQGIYAMAYEKPVHQVTVSSFYIGKYEVTQELWKAVMNNNPSHFKGNPRLPVEQVTWEECQDFLNKLNQLTGRHFRLLTEAEWEFAARGGNQSKGYKYAGNNYLGGVAWYSENSNSSTHVVGQKSPNELGIYDMSGNVWEWCQDWFGSSYYSSSSSFNPTGPNSGSDHVCRGGCWSFEAESCRLSYRHSWGKSYQYGSNWHIGLRLAASSL